MTFGKPSYRNHIAEIVAKYGHNVINTDSFTYQNLANFMAGVAPNPHLVKILDVYMQIVKSDIRARFFEERYVQVLGDNFADFLGSKTGVSDDFCDSLCGLYEEAAPNSLRGTAAFAEAGRPTVRQSRYFFIRRFSSNRYLTCHQFTAASTRDADRAVFGRRLISGFVIPNERYSVVLMRTLRDQVHRAGMLYQTFAANGVTEVSLRARDFYEFDKKLNRLSRGLTPPISMGGLQFNINIGKDEGSRSRYSGENRPKSSDETSVMKNVRTETVLDFIQIKPTDALSNIVASIGGLL